jgi:predicted acyl esterase
MNKVISQPGSTSKSEIADGMRIDWDVLITMDDGAVLRADLFRPIAEGRYPVIMAHGPYGKGMAFYDGHFKIVWDMMTSMHPETAAASSNRYQAWEMVDPERWTREGYACVRVDSRGSGRSPGVIDLFSPRETQDYYNCIEWAGVQDWSTGKVGLCGISYYAINQWLVASLKPPHLAAMFAFEGAADCYRDISRHGGILTTFWDFLIGHQILTIQNGVGIRGYRSKVTGDLVSGPMTLTDEQLAANYKDTFAGQKAHELDGQYYRERSPDWSKIEVPFCSAGSWGGQGLHLRGNTEAFTEAVSEQKFLEMHGLEHWTHFYTNYGFRLQKRFFDRYLKGIEDAWTDSPRVRLQIRYPGNRFVERGEDEWPIARTRWTKFYLDAHGLRLTRKPPDATGSVTYAGFSDGVVFLSDPFEEETEITGPSAAKVVLSSSTEDADLFLVLRVFGPDLKEHVFIGSQDPFTPLTMGWLRASHRKIDERLSLPWRPYHPHDEKWLLKPGETVECDVEIWPTSIVVPAGFRIGLAIRGKDYVAPFAQPRPIFDKGRPAPNGVGASFHNDGDDRPAKVFGGEVTLITNPDKPAYILLPIIPARR